MNSWLIVLVMLVIVGMVAGCERQPEPAVEIVLDQIGPGDECHVCGMMIAGFPGPKAQAFVSNREQPFLFCSTLDLFSWLLQPETAAIARAAYVHDMGATDWQNPSSDAFTEAGTAWYVVGHSLKGAMGPTLASFAERGQADRFAGEFGGTVLDFSAVDIDVLRSLASAHSHAHGHH